MPFDAIHTVAHADLAREAADQGTMLLPTVPVYQRTLAAPVTFSDIGIHSGARVTMRLLPAAPNSGINFVRTDLTENNVIPARYDLVTDTVLCTVLTNAAGAKVATVEHILSALAGLGIDNLTIELDAAEVPVADGSAEPFIDALRATGVVAQAAPRRALQILRTVEVVNGNKIARITPSTASEYCVTIIYSNAVIGTQTYDYELSPVSYVAEIAAARTFALRTDVDALHAAGLGLGGSHTNAVVVNDTGIENEEGLRFENEFARHKVLDAIGDMALAGGVVLGRLEGTRSGHALNNQLLRAVFADAANYRWVDLPEALVPAPVVYAGYTLVAAE